MARDQLLVSLDRPDATYRPGEPIRGVVLLDLDESVTGGLGLLLRLDWETRGHGQKEAGGAARQVLSPGPFMAGERLELPFELACPPGPFSLESSHVSVAWIFEARLDVPCGKDPTVLVPLTVVSGPCEEPFVGPSAGEYREAPPRFESMPGET
ncbi:MAG: hypothetical protein RL653_2385 [Pseudomonadota bacterium]|jgi:hypothetical protein